MAKAARFEFAEVPVVEKNGHMHFDTLGCYGVLISMSALGYELGNGPFWRILPPKGYQGHGVISQAQRERLEEAVEAVEAGRDCPHPDMRKINALDDEFQCVVCLHVCRYTTNGRYLDWGNEHYTRL